MSTDEQQPAPDEEQQPAPDEEQQPAPGEEQQPAPDEDQDDEDHDDEDQDQFPRHYVKRLRDRSAGYRSRAKEAEQRADGLARALFTERVRALDVLADPTDLPFNPDMLEDPTAMLEAVDALVAGKPHLRRRGVAGTETGSRERSDPQEGVSLLGLMRGGA